MKKLLSTLLSLIALALVMLTQTIPASASNSDVTQGRELLYRKHVDAAHVVWEDNGLKVKIVDGAEEVDPNKYIVRLGPDADRAGNEVSRIKSPGGKFSFLGKAGTIVWNAPSQLYDDWAPVWAGFGAGKFPTEIVEDKIFPETVKLNLVSVDGPGKVEVYNNYAQRYFSSTDPKFRSNVTMPGDHGHVNWAFSQPGKYIFTWKATAKTRDGNLLESPEQQVIWLVGSDEQVGLPPGTTNGRAIAVPAEQFPDPKPNDETETPVSPNLDPPFDKSLNNPTLDLGEDCVKISHGHQDIRASWDGKFDEDGYPEMIKTILKDDSTTPSRLVKDYHAVVLLPDNAKSIMPKIDGANDLIPVGHAIWQIPEVQMKGVPWLGFSVEDIKFESLKEVKFNVEVDTDIPGAHAIMGHSTLNGYVMDADLTNSTLYPQRIANPTHLHKSLIFSHPGYYSVTVSFNILAKQRLQNGDPAQNYGTYTFYLAVGNEAIKGACKNPLKPDSGDPGVTPKPNPTQPVAPGSNNPGKKSTDSNHKTVVVNPSKVTKNDDKTCHGAADCMNGATDSENRKYALPNAGADGLVLPAAAIFISIALLTGLTYFRFRDYR